MITTQLRTATPSVRVDPARRKAMEHKIAFAKVLLKELEVEAAGMIMTKLAVILILMSLIETILL